MNTEYNYPGNDLDNKKWNKEQELNANAQNTKNNQAPDKERNYKVLGKDGSLADLPDENVAGKGALDGTVGLGT